MKTTPEVEKAKAVTVEIVEMLFPKGECSERSAAIVLHARMWVEFEKLLTTLTTKHQEELGKAVEARDIEYSELRGKYKGMEASWMHLRDQYSEIARALGFDGDAWFGDPLASHEEIVSRAKKLAALATNETPTP